MENATAEKPIVVIDRTTDGAWVLIAGRAEGDTYDSHYYAPTADIAALGVEMPPDEKLPGRIFLEDGGMPGVYLRQAHAIAQHKAPNHPWTNRLSNPATYKNEWVGLGYWSHL